MLVVSSCLTSPSSSTTTASATGAVRLPASAANAAAAIKIRCMTPPPAGAPQRPARLPSPHLPPSPSHRGGEQDHTGRERHRQPEVVPSRRAVLEDDGVLAA